MPLKRQHESVALNPAETLLREIFLDCKKYLTDHQMSTAAELQIRVSGEWVRNKPLGIPTTRLNICLSTMVGTEFGDFVNSFSHDNPQVPEACIGPTSPEYRLFRP